MVIFQIEMACFCLMFNIKKSVALLLCMFVPVSTIVSLFLDDILIDLMVAISEAVVFQPQTKIESNFQAHVVG